VYFVLFVRVEELDLARRIYMKLYTGGGGGGLQKYAYHYAGRIKIR
jgi:hypothetical protein